ncbi:MAG: hypothetical protein K6G25_11735 [Bacteroidales bacterium]|nr:hypothetical protein [Bacteroidales bacterium]
MKRNIILLAIIALVFSGCRKEADYHPYIGETGDLAYDSYTTQFEFLWKCISTGYVFWDVDETDWDAVYNEYMPKFNALDAMHDAGQEVTLAELDTLYQDVFGGMKDHHMTVVLRNLFPAAGDNTQYVVVRPGQMEVEKRDYYIESRSEEQTKLIAFFGDMETEYDIEVHESATANVEELGTSVTYHYFLIKLADGRKIPYLWQSMAALTPVLRDTTSAGYPLLSHWLTAITETPREQLAGIILDNRANSGGYQDDLDYLIGTYLNERTEILKTRYKEGPGRYEHSAWTPYYIDPQTRYHRDITAEHIPYVIICDINSVSMAEIEPLTIKAVLPTSYVIGERTFGGTGPLQPTSSIDLNYGGPFGNYTTMHHYVYTSTFEAQIGGKVLEGIGCTPDQTVLRKDHNGSFKPQLDAAIEYITNYK